jgi:hypothetical protein
LLVNGVPATEKDVADRVLAELSADFEIRREVSGTHLSGMPVRVDAVLWPKEGIRWQGETYFGVEFKHITQYSNNAYMKWMAQAVDYSYSTFGRSHRRIPIYCCPGFAGSEKDVFFARRFLGQFNVGELRTGYQDRWELRMSDALVWRQHEGRSNLSFSFKPKTGSR